MFRTPSNEGECQARDALLSACLRADEGEAGHGNGEMPTASGMRAEYPIVLSPQNRQFSHLAFAADEPVAHLNAWPRDIIDREGRTRYKGLFIGNVATHPAWRNRGLSRALMDHAAAAHPGADFIVLWSDLLAFYGRLGFTAPFQETRYSFTADSLRGMAADFSRPLTVFATALHEIPITHLTVLRPSLPLGIRRTAAETVLLTAIPEVYCAVLGSWRDPDAFCLIGKGADLKGVIHEWGARSPGLLVQLIKRLGVEHGIDQLLMLSPVMDDSRWDRCFRPLAATTTQHPMALFKPLKLKDLEALRGLFIWGLDSI